MGGSVGVAVGEAVSVSDADAVSVGLAAGKSEAEPLAVAPTQPAATNTVSAASAVYLRHRRSLANDEFTTCPLRNT